jgi:PII-like signaling protein
MHLRSGPPIVVTIVDTSQSIQNVIVVIVTTITLIIIQLLIVIKTVTISAIICNIVTRLLYLQVQ